MYCTHMPPQTRQVAKGTFCAIQRYLQIQPWLEKPRDKQAYHWLAMIEY